MAQEAVVDFEKEGIELLKDFGLDEDEAKVYLGLLRMGSSKASEISHFTQTDRVRGYKILENLKNQGFVTSTLSSPIKFSANEPKEILLDIIKKRKQEAEKLENNVEKLLEILNKVKTNQETANLPKLTVISGRENIYDQIIKIIDETTDELYLVTTVSDLIRMYYTDIPEAIKKASKRNVVIKLMTELEISTKLECAKRLGVNYFKIAKLPSQGRIICNSSQVLMSGYTSSTSSQSTSDDSALVTNSDEISGNMRSLCKFMWKIGKEIRVDKTKDEPSQQKETTALVVDDDPDAVEMFSDYLEIKGIQVVGKCKNGKEGVDVYEQLRPDVVFLDIMMPEYDGFYALKKIREINPESKVIMVTADFTSETKKKLREMKPTDVIYKPYDVEKILGQLF
ncbi:histidine kinase [Nitrosopumilus sp. b1]|uniref:response regulator n=1 Tax=Nitrosopumilus sp. b1 TaxID=2109907 RepID=UPI0015F63324|nr:response regulator [Nitrosopumilus sp. b1]KAF6242373.1 histidine kinase [Nitrosopumilus sp. b1]